MNGNLRVGSLFGIPFFINLSWFFVLALVTLNFGNGLAASFPDLGAGALILGLISGLLLFASVLLHELGHSFAAQQRGIKVNSITLFLFGGLASLDDEAKTPEGTFWIAIAGPLVSLALFLLLAGITASEVVTGPLLTVLGLLAYINLALAIFNMIPGLPLDGGNVLRAIVWKISGNRFQGIRWASTMGQLVGGIAIAFGVLAVLGISNVGSFWSLIIGWFILQNAGQSAQSARIQETLSGLTAADAVVKDSPIVRSHATLRDLADLAITSKRQNSWKRFLVVDDADQLLGSIDLDSLQSVTAAQWPEHEVAEFLQPIDAQYQVDSNQPLLEVIQRLEKHKTQAIAVIRENGTLIGLLEKSSVVQLLQTQRQSQPA